MNGGQGGGVYGLGEAPGEAAGEGGAKRSTMEMRTAVRQDGVRCGVRGKGLVRGGEAFVLRAVCYGPTAVAGPPSYGLPGRDRRLRDLDAIAAYGFNGVRLYELPSPCILDELEERGLVALLGVPWCDHIAGFTRGAGRVEVVGAVRRAVRELGGHGAVCGWLVGNEVGSGLVRWEGARRIGSLLDELLDVVRDEAPGVPCGYASYPSSEVLDPARADFSAWNLYLEGRDKLEGYLRRLQLLAGDRPLVISEFGIDAGGVGGMWQAEVFRWFHEACAEAAVAGSCWFSFTDEWVRGGVQVGGWSFGLTDAGRAARPALRGAGEVWGELVTRGRAGGGELPLVSVIVCTRNGGRTLRACLESLGSLDYPHYEVLVVDDGSEGEVGEIARGSGGVRYLYQEHGGLSRARNLGAGAARGEWLAYTDDDCVVERDWLMRMANELVCAEAGAVGGPNIPPPARGEVEAAVALAPGGPAHVMLDDLRAEHLPGCNLVVRRDVFREIGGFSERYRQAGDDVDLCWRILDAGYELRYVAGAVVWHHRRSTVGGYLRQQVGYGKAEAMLVIDHPRRFGRGGMRWGGVVYGVRGRGRPVVYHGEWGLAPYQFVYRAGVDGWWERAVGWGYWALVVVLGVVGGAVGGWGGIGVVAALVLGVLGLWRAWGAMRVAAGSRPDGRASGLLYLLCVGQGVARSWGRWREAVWPAGGETGGAGLWERLGPWLPGLRGLVRGWQGGRGWVIPAGERRYWGEGSGRIELLEALAKGGARADGGHWGGWDLGWGEGPLFRVWVQSLTESHGGGQLTRVRVRLALARGGLAGWGLGLGLLCLAPLGLVLGWGAAQRAWGRVSGAAGAAGLRELGG